MGLLASAWPRPQAICFRRAVQAEGVVATVPWLSTLLRAANRGKLAANSGNRYPGGVYLTVRFNESGRRHVLKDFFPSDFRNNLAEFVSPLFPSSGFSRVFSCLVPRQIACTSVLLAAIDILRGYSQRLGCWSELDVNCIKYTKLPEPIGWDLCT